MENRLENFERELGEKNSRAQAELLQFIQQNVERRNAEICSQFEQQKQKTQEEIQQSVSHFISQCQQGGNAVENIANCHKQLLSIEVERQVEGKSQIFEKSVKDFLDGQLSEILKREKEIEVRFSGLFDQVGICSRAVGENKLELQKEISALQNANRELCSGVNRRFTEIAAGLKTVGEESKTNFGTLVSEMQQRFQTVNQESKALGDRLTGIEKFLGSQEVPWDKVVEMMGKTEETIQIQVRREMAAQVRKMMEIMMTQMMEEKMRQVQKEEHFDKLRNDMENCMKQQFCAILGKIQTDFSKEKSHREVVQNLCNNFEARLKAIEGRVQQILTETVQPKASTVTQPKPVFKANSGFVGIKGVKPVQPIEIWDLNLGLEGGPDLGDGSLMVGQVSINAIGGASERSPMITVASAATQHILRNVVVPKFSGHAGDWPNFKDEWGRFIRKFNQVSEADKLGLLELCLDDLGKKQLNLHLDEMGEALTFNEVWAKLDAWHSRNEEFGARKNFRDLTLCHQGRVTSRDWENFKVDFKLCRQK
eukprot:EG_transcript_9131